MVFGIDGLVAALDCPWSDRHHLADTALGSLRNVFSALKRPKIFVQLQLFSATDPFPPAYHGIWSAADGATLSRLDSTTPTADRTNISPICVRIFGLKPNDFWPVADQKNVSEGRHHRVRQLMTVTPMAALPKFINRRKPPRLRNETTHPT